ncbi:MAG: ankyrin repeat domain-containing protein [Sediminicola sp.]|tara:strand:+ start:60622 stop:61014 length:393 start_codon:yes stop_codon:yes gene_type:complete
MKKTILSISAAFLLMAGSVQAATLPNNILDNNVLEISANPEISSFCKAIMQGDVETVKSLIALGEDVNQKSLGMTPAIFAARYNKAEILQLLIDNGANLKIKCDKGMTVKKYAELSNAQDALAVLEANTK